MSGLWQSVRGWWTGALRENQQRWCEWRVHLGTGPSWTALLQHAAATGERSRPTVAWTRQVPDLLGAVPLEPLCQAIASVDLVGWRSRTEQGLSPEDTTVVRGLVWMLGESGDPRAAAVVSQLAERSFRKIPGQGPASTLLGNACLLALSRLPLELGAAELTRLSTTVRYPSARNRIEQLLGELGARTGVDEDELRELGPTFGLDPDGRRDEPLGDYTARLFLADDTAQLGFVNRAGKLLKGTPKHVRLQHHDRYAALLEERKALAAQLEGHRRRLERSWLLPTPIPWDRFSERYVAHPVVGFLARRLLWEVDGTVALWTDGAMRGLAGEALQGPVRLWHPLQSTGEDLEVWKDRLEELGIEPALPQLRRGEVPPSPIGQVLDQRQLLARCQRRGWTYALQGAFDSDNDPYLELPGTGLSIELQVEPVPGLTDGIYDQVVVRGLIVTRDGEESALEALEPWVRAEVLFEVQQLTR